MIITSIDYGMPTYADPEILTFTTGATAVTAAAIPHGTQVQLFATEDCYIAFGAIAPAAAATTHKLPKDVLMPYTIHGPTFIGAKGMINTGTLTITRLTMGGGA